MIIRPLQTRDFHQVPRLIAGFRVALVALTGCQREPNLATASLELVEYVRKGWPFFVAENAQGQLVGYLVCREDDGTLWVESIYVDPSCRRLGIADQLFDAAQALLPEGETLFNWVHPNNHAIIGFLRKRGYTVLNLIEVRKPWVGEQPQSQIIVGAHTFDY